jgi:hypothetical protein
VSGSSYAVYGFSSSGIAVHGASLSGTKPSIQGWGKNGRAGVVGYSGSSVPPNGPGKVGVYGISDLGVASIGVLGRSPTGRGGAFSGKLAQLRLSPSGAASHPASGSPGDLFVDASHRLWFCKGGATWKQLA